MRRVTRNTSVVVALALAASGLARSAGGDGAATRSADQPSAIATQPAGDADEIGRLRATVESAPDDVAARVALAKALERDGDNAGVVDALRPVADALDVDGTILLARVMTRSGRPAQSTEVLRAALKRTPSQAALWCELAQQELDSQRYGAALRIVQEARKRLKTPPPQLGFMAATARFHLGQALGATSVRAIPGGRAGQFVGEWLLVEQRGDDDRFLCCPRDSALYELRKALDNGLDNQAADRLHAEIWASAGRPEIGLQILKSREAAWRSGPDCESLRTLADLSLACGEAREYLQYSRRLARLDADKADAVMYKAYVAAAKLYNQRGDQAMYRELLERALEIRQDDVELMLALGDATWESGDHEQARVWYRRMLALDPDHPQRIRIMERLEP